MSLITEIMPTETITVTTMVVVEETNTSPMDIDMDMDMEEDKEQPQKMQDKNASDLLTKNLHGPEYQTHLEVFYGVPT